MSKDHLHFVHDNVFPDVLHPNRVNDPVHLMELMIMLIDDEDSQCWWSWWRSHTQADADADAYIDATGCL